MSPLPFPVIIVYHVIHKLSIDSPEKIHENCIFYIKTVNRHFFERTFVNMHNVL